MGCRNKVKVKKPKFLLSENGIRYCIKKTIFHIFFIFRYFNYNDMNLKELKSSVLKLGRTLRIYENKKQFFWSPMKQDFWKNKKSCRNCQKRRRRAIEIIRCRRIVFNSYAFLEDINYWTLGLLKKYWKGPAAVV